MQEYDILTLFVECQNDFNNLDWDHSFSTYAKFSEKLIYFNP